MGFHKEETYSHFVRFMKIALPSLAAIIFAAIIIIPQFNSPKNDFDVTDGIDLDSGVSFEVRNARFYGTDEKNQPFALTMESASDIDKNSQMIELKNPKADISFNDQRWLAVKAQTGYYDQQAQNIHLTGSVSLYYDQGYNLESSDIRIDVKKSIAESKNAIIAIGPIGKIKADGFSFEKNKNYHFTGKVKLFLTSSKPQLELTHNNQGEKIILSADQGMIWDPNNKELILYKNALAIKGNMQLSAQEIHLHYKILENGEKEITDLQAQQNVHLLTPTEEVRGSFLKYNLAEKTIQIKGAPGILKQTDYTITTHDQIEYNQKKQTAILHKAIIEDQNKRKIQADLLLASFIIGPSNRLLLDTVDASRNVLIQNDQEIITGEHAVYQAQTGNAIVTGSPKLMRGKNQLTGDQLHVNLKTGKSVLKTDKQQNPETTNRIEGVFYPSEKK